MRLALLRPLLTSGFCLLSSLLSADILEDKEGNLLECKFVRDFQEKDKSGKPQLILVVKLEDGSERKYNVKQDVKQYVKTKQTSWEIKAENKKWFEKESAGVKELWKSQEDFAKKCQRKGLDEEAGDHFRKAYALRKTELETRETSPKPGEKSLDDAAKEKARMELADWLEKCDLFDEAYDERKSVYNLRKTKLDAGTPTVADRRALADWCKRLELSEEALEQFQKLVEIDPANVSVKKEYDRLKKSIEIPMDAKFLRIARIRMGVAAKYVRSRQNSDGSFGADFVDNGVHTHRAITALSGIALLCDWDFSILSGKVSDEEVPKEILRAIDFILEFKPARGSGLAGEDVWGPIFGLDFFVRCYKRRQFQPTVEGDVATPSGAGASTSPAAAYREKLKAGIEELIAEVKGLQRSDGGWYYYNFVQESASFVTASAVASLLSAKEAGFDLGEIRMDEALKCIVSQKTGEGTYNYFNMRELKQGPVGACARSSVCEFALMAGGQGQRDDIKRSIDIFFANRHILEKLRGSPETHIGKGKTAPYYLLFSHYWTSRAIKYLDKSKRKSYLNALLHGNPPSRGLFAYQEGDGTFGDWSGNPEHWKTYGTALAAMTFYHTASTALELSQDPGDQ